MDSKRNKSAIYAEPIKVKGYAVQPFSMIDASYLWICWCVYVSVLYTHKKKTMQTMHLNEVVITQSKKKVLWYHIVPSCLWTRVFVHISWYLCASDGLSTHSLLKQWHFLPHHHQKSDNIAAVFCSSCFYGYSKHKMHSISTSLL